MKWDSEIQNCLKQGFYTDTKAFSGCPLKCDSKFQLKMPFLYVFPVFQQ